jgi:hypothetical protein
MLLSKIILNTWVIGDQFKFKKFLIIFPFFLFTNRPDDVQNILSGKLALRYAGREAEALKAIAQSAIKRSLAQFQQVCSYF